jgi:NCS1 family nucleobase:cation symporter-1
VFVPMFAVFAVDYFLLGGRRTWSTTLAAPTRFVVLVPWLVGVATYQLVSPGDVAGWSHLWTSIQSGLGWTTPSWMSASLTSFAVAGVLTLLLAPWVRRSAGRS